MPIITVPNVSEGRDEDRIAGLVEAIEASGARVLDVHSDATHNRSVLTVVAARDGVPAAMTALAAAATYINLEDHVGVHPRLGALDVCPVVAYGISLEEAVAVARQTGRAVAERTEVPVFLYGAAARRESTRELPVLRRGGLAGLIERAAAGLRPDFGPRTIDPRRGVVCVGARGVLIAFNVWLRCDRATAQRIAACVRTASGGPPGVRALGLDMSRATSGRGSTQGGRPDPGISRERGEGLSQVSMNLVEPHVTGIDQAFGYVAEIADREGVAIEATELVGLVPEQLAPDPNGRAARLLIGPGRSLESVLQN